MSKNFFDFDDDDLECPYLTIWQLIQGGNFMMRMSDNMAMDMDTGDIHFISGWSDDEDD